MGRKKTQIAETASKFKEHFLVIPKLVWQKFEALCDAAGHNEIHWFTTIERTRNIFRVNDDIMVPKQQITGTTVSSSAAELIESLDSHINMWCHSHVLMQCNPSARDLKEKSELVMGTQVQSDKYIIMLIMNKRGEVNAWFDSHFYDCQMTIVIEDYDNPFEEWAINMVAEKCEEKKFVQHAPMQAGFYNTGAYPKQPAANTVKRVGEMTEEEFEKYDSYWRSNGY